MADEKKKPEAPNSKSYFTAKKRDAHGFTRDSLRYTDTESDLASIIRHLDSAQAFYTSSAVQEHIKDSSREWYASAKKNIAKSLGHIADNNITPEHHEVRLSQQIEIDKGEGKKEKVSVQEGVLKGIAASGLEMLMKLNIPGAAEYKKLSPEEQLRALAHDLDNHVFQVVDEEGNKTQSFKDFFEGLQSGKFNGQTIGQVYQLFDKMLQEAQNSYAQTQVGKLHSGFHRKMDGLTYGERVKATRDTLGKLGIPLGDKKYDAVLAQLGPQLITSLYEGHKRKQLSPGYLAQNKLPEDFIDFGKLSYAPPKKEK